MNIAEPFVRRPVMTTLVMAAILIFGIVSYRALPVSDLPNVDFPTIQVSANLPGASPETMASAVATPLEKQFSTIAGVDSMTSSSSQGSTSITLQFNLNRDIDAAAQDVQAMIAKAQRDLPRDMPSAPSYQKVNPADSPVLFLSLSSATLPLAQVNEYAETMLAQRISMVQGVAQVQIYGAQKYAVRAQLDPRQLATRGIGVDEVVTAIQRGNVNLPTGTMHGANQALTVQASGQLTDAAAYRPLIVAYRNGSPVRLEELGRVIDSVENDKIAGWFNNDRSITLAIQKQPGTNTVAVVDAIKKLLPTIQQQMPAAVKLTIRFDRSATIRESVADVKFTLMLTIFLVIMVIFLFLRNLSATIIPSTAVPMSLIGTFCVMYVLGYSLDNLSLMALTLSVGFVVDDAIVMLENIVRHMEAGERPFQATLRGAREIGFTIVSMTLSLAAVFIPVLFMGGILGRLLHEFAVTIGAAILVSGFVSLTLTPMLCSRFLKPHAQQHHGKFYQRSERIFDAGLGLYARSLGYVMRHRLATMVISIVMAVATFAMFYHFPKGFLPNEDLGQLLIFTESAQGTSFENMVRHQRELAKVVAASPYIESYMSSVDSRGGGATNQGRFFVQLKPRGQRPSAERIIEELRPQLASVPGIMAFPQMLPPIRVGGQLTKSPYQFTLQDADTKELYEYAPRLEAKMRDLGILTDVTSDLQLQNPQLDVKIDRDRAAALGITAEQIEVALQTAYAARQVSTIFAPNNQYRVIVELQPEFYGDPRSLSMLYVRSATGQLVPMDSLATVSRSLGPLSVNHLGQLPAVTISFNTKPGVALGDAVTAINRVARETLPSTVSTSFQGTAQAFEASQQGLLLLITMAILVIYIVLGILYESFIHPITILSGLPSAGFGALVTLGLFGSDLNLYAFVGVIMLVGIVKKNAIMMIDFAIEAQRKEGKEAATAIYDGALVRFRPIMMTTMAALMGTLPIALGWGAGAESRRPLGLAVVGGLLVSQVLTLYITPVFYTYMESFQEWLRGRRQKPVELMAEEEADEVTAGSDARRLAGD